MTKFSYNFDAINKGISLELQKDIYQKDEVLRLLKNVYVAVDYEIINIEYDIFSKIKTYISNIQDVRTMQVRDIEVKEYKND